MAALPAFAASSPTIRAMLVTIAAVPPKLILVVLIMSNSLAWLTLGLGDDHHRGKPLADQTPPDEPIHVRGVTASLFVQTALC